MHNNNTTLRSTLEHNGKPLHYSSLEDNQLYKVTGLPSLVPVRAGTLARSDVGSSEGCRPDCHEFLSLSLMNEILSVWSFIHTRWQRVDYKSTVWSYTWTTDEAVTLHQVMVPISFSNLRPL